MFDPDKQTEFDEQLAEAAKHYPLEFVSTLAHKFGLKEPVQIERLRDGLAWAAWVYLYRRDRNEKIKTGPVRDELKEIAQLADGLDSKLDALTAASSELLWSGQRHVQANLHWTNANVSPYGHTIVRWEYPSGTKSVTILREGQIREAVRILGNLARDSFVLVGVDKGGRPHDDSLLLWVFNAQKLWEEILGANSPSTNMRASLKTKRLNFAERR
jgi:hypothetical protein